MKTNNLKKQLAAVTAVALTFSSVPAVSAGAEEINSTETIIAQTVAENAETDAIDTEAELIAAIAAGGNIVIGGDIVLTAPITITNEVNLTAVSDVTITANGVTDVFTVTTGALSLGSGINVVSDTSILYANGGKISIDGASLSNTANSTYNLGFATNGGSITVNSGTVTGNNGDSTLSAKGATSYIYVNGGKVLSTANSAIVVKGGNAVVDGGAVETTASGGYIAIYTYEGNPSGGTITIKSGTVTSATGSAVDANLGGTASVEGGTLTSGEGISPVTSSGTGSATVSGGEFYSGETKVQLDESGDIVVDTIIDTEAELIAAIAQGGNIVVGGDIVLTAPITITNEVNLTAASDVTITANGVTDVFTVTTGALSLGSGINVVSDTSILYANGGKISIDGASLSNTANSTYNLGFATNGGSITVNSGTVTGNNGDSTLSAKGATSYIYVNGGKVLSTANSAIVVKGGNAVVDGGAVETTASGGYIAIYTYEGNPSGGTITIKSGTVTSATGAAVDANLGGTAAVEGGTLTSGEGISPVTTSGTGSATVSGGTFSAEISDDYLAEGFVSVENEDGSYSVEAEPEVIALTPVIEVQDVIVSADATAEEIEANIKLASNVTFTDAEGNEVTDITCTLVVTDADDDDATTYTVAVASISTEGYTLAEVEPTAVTITIEEAEKTTDKWIANEDGTYTWTAEDASLYGGEDASWTALNLNLADYTELSNEEIGSITVEFEVEGNANGSIGINGEGNAWLQTSFSAESLVAVIDCSETALADYASSVLVQLYWAESGDVITVKSVTIEEKETEPEVVVLTPAIEVADVTVSEDAAAEEIEAAIEAAATVTFTDAEGSEVADIAYELVVTDADDDDATTYTVAVASISTEGYTLAEVEPTNVTITITEAPVAETETAEITVCKAQNGRVALNWAEVEGAEKYAIYMWTKGGSIKCVGTREAGVTGAYVKGLTNGTKYGFLVRSYNGEKWSAYEAADWAYAIPCDPAKPAISACIATAADKVALNWTAVEGAEQYAIYTYVDGKYKCVGGRAANVTGMFVRNLESGKEYGFLVRAKVDGKWTAYTTADIVYATTL